jgi:ABC-2 type transport system ATP-binding protein
MKQKLGLTCALIHTPKVLLLDEPTTGVDPVSRRDFWRVLYELRESGVSIVISTAYLDEAERCHRLALLQEGRLLHCNTPQGIKATMKGALLSITTEDPTAVQRVARTLPCVASTLLMGDAVHVLVDNPQRLEELRQALSMAHIPVKTMDVITPAIEDLFVSLDASGKDPGHGQD